MTGQDRTSYIGRDDELVLAQRLLAAGPLVTLVGPGGVGKTRLAGRIAAREEARFPDGVVLVELAELRDAQLLASTVAGRLGLHDQSSRPTVDVLIEHLRGMRMLLLLDNCEHLISACADLVSALIAACPQLVVLATSRQSLGVAGEHLIQVPPLPLPPEPDRAHSAERVAESDAVRLFVDRAVAVLPSFTITEDNYRDVAQLCRELEGLPLAIELAAVRLRSLSLSQITERLSHKMRLLTGGRRTAPRRQQTLRTLIDWSHQLCSPAEQLVWARASVFSGSFDLTAAEQVCGGDGVEDSEVLDLIHSLLDKSILSREDQDGQARYRMLETLREYGHDLLERSGDRPRVARLHRDFYAELTARWHAEWIGRDQVAWVARLRAEHANLRVALDYCVTEPGEATVALEMITRVDLYWGIRGALTEARLWLERADAAAPPRAPERVAAYRLDGWFALLQGDTEGGVAQLVKAGDLVAETGDEVQDAHVTLVWGMAALFTGNEARSRDLFAQALTAFDAHQERIGGLYASFTFGLATAVSGEVDQGRSRLRKTIAECEEIGEIFWRSWALWALSAVELLYGDNDEAELCAKQGLRLTQLISNRLAEAFLVTILSGTAMRKSRYTRAMTLIGVSDAMWDALAADPDRFGMFGTERRQRIDASRNALGDAASDAERARGRALPKPEAVRHALEEPTTTESTTRSGKPLTKRETEIADLIAEGLTNKDIAAKLFISQRTAETHVDHILTKLGFHNRAQVAAWTATTPRASEPE
ncbi:ATP-binding protein [Actinokineospora alba]|uniref:ATP-binding protein n=1 Tax=Actinokineospora alba TaxID=504798 RepID=UPI001E5943EC|nr:LuxR C-terminal-related transcriptional regulator [Actinokineospora alba]